MKKEIFEILKYFLIFIGIQIVVSGIVAAFMGFNEDGSMDMSTDLVIISSIASNVVAIIVFLGAKWQKFSLSFFKDSKNWAVMLACVVISLGLLIPTTYVEELIDLPDIAEDIFRGVMSTSYGYIAVCIFAPIVEELVFRGAIQSAAQRMFGEGRHWYAIAVSAILFALVHMNLAQMPHAFLLGLLMGWLRYSSDSIMPGVVVHWTNNTVAYLLAYLYPRSLDMKIEDFFGNETWRLAAAIILSIIVFVLAINQIRTLVKGNR